MGKRPPSTTSQDHCTPAASIPIRWGLFLSRSGCWFPVGFLLRVRGCPACCPPLCSLSWGREKGPEQVLLAGPSPPFWVGAFAEYVQVPDLCPVKRCGTFPRPQAVPSASCRPRGWALEARTSLCLHLSPTSKHFTKQELPKLEFISVSKGTNPQTRDRKDTAQPA